MKRKKILCTGVADIQQNWHILVIHSVAHRALALFVVLILWVVMVIRVEQMTGLLHTVFLKSNRKLLQIYQAKKPNIRPIYAVNKSLLWLVAVCINVTDSQQEVKISARSSL